MGTLIMGKAPLGVSDVSIDGDGHLQIDVLSLSPGVVAAALGKAEDAAHSSGDVGVMLLGVRKDTAAALAGTDGDYIPVIVDANGRLHVLDANSAAIKTAVEIMDDWDETDRAKVNPIVGQAGIAAGAGAVGVTVPRVTLASDDPGVTALQVMDDWDETDRAKVNLIVGQAGIAAGAGAVGVTVPRVTLASDDPAVAALQILDDIVSGSEAQVDIVSLPNEGQQTMANSISVAVASDQSNVPIAQAVTVTVPTQITKTVAAVATPEALAADGTFFQTATLIGKKAARTDNVGIVYLGIGSANDTQALEIAPGDVWVLNAPPGQKYDLNDWYLDVLNVGDGLVIVYS